MKVILALFLFLIVSCVHTTPQHAPQAEKIPYLLKKHEDTRIDAYHWLKERENPKVIEYLKKENTYTTTIMKSVQPLEQEIFNELKSRIKENESSVPAKEGDYFYSARFEAGQQYPLYVRQKGSTQAAEEILLNNPVLAQEHSFFESSSPLISPNQKMLAYAIDTVGRRFFTIYFRDLTKNQTLSMKIENVTGNLVWANDNATIFYSQQNPETLRSEKIYSYNIKTQERKLIYDEKDETFSVFVYKPLSQNYIYISSSSTLSSEIRYVKAHQPKSTFKVFTPRDENHEYSVIDNGDQFFILTNKNAKNFKVMTAPLDHTHPSHWRELISHREDTFIQDITVFKKYLVLDERKNGLTQIEVTDPKGSHAYYIPFVDDTYVATVGDNREFDSEWLRFNYESMRLPSSVYDFSMQSREQILKKTREIPNFNPELYQTSRIFVTVRDGTQVPVSLLMKKNQKLNGTAPLLLYGYGSYGITMDPWYDSQIFSLIDRGFIFAKVHVRGGSEMGRAWYDQGRAFNKKNTFYDFIDCSEELIKRKYADPRNLYAMGGSAGGLLMGAIMNLRPDLYKGIIAQVPFVDVITTMLDDSIPLTTAEYDEWGNPNEKTAYDYIKSYSPYDNVMDHKYPSALVTTGLHDSQVQYWEPAKWVAKLREHNLADSQILLKTDMTAGHGGASGRYNQLKDTATEYAFILMLWDRK